MDLIHQPWIPVLLTDGGSAVVGLEEALTGADTIRSVDAEAPVRRSIERLLIAIAYHSHPDAPWRDLWARGLQGARVRAYLDARRSAFDSARFLQYRVTSASRAGAGGMDRLVLGSEGLYSPTALDRADEAGAARLLLARLLWDASGIRTGLAGDPMSSGGRSMPIGPALLAAVPTAVVRAETLARTIALNIPDPPGSSAVEDAPMWDDDPRRPRGVYEPHLVGPGRILVWPGRRLRLHRAADGDVTGAVLANGDQIRLDGLAGIEAHGVWRRIPGKTKKAPARVLPRPPEDMDAPWSALIDRGGPRPIGLQRILDGAPGAPTLVSLETVFAALGPKGSTITSIEAEALDLAVDGLAQRIGAVELIHAHITMIAWAHVQARSLGRPEIDTRTAREQTNEQRSLLVQDARVVEAVREYLRGGPLDTAALDEATQPLQEEAERLAYIARIGRTAQSGTPGTAIPAIMVKSRRELHEELVARGVL